MQARLFSVLLVLTTASVSRADEKAAAELNGKWPIVSATEAGRKWASDFVPQPRIVVNGSRFCASFGPIILFEGTITADAAKMPKTIDLKCTGGRHSGKTLPGIYELKGEVLWICFAEPNGKRPTDFASTDKSKTSLFECDRRKADWWPAFNYNDKNERPRTRMSLLTLDTNDDFDKVASYYEEALGKFATLKFSLDDGKGNNIGIDSGPGRIVAGGTATVSVSPEEAQLWSPLFNVKFDPDARVNQTGQDTSYVIEDAKDGARREVTARIYTQETTDYTITVTMTRAKDEKHTHIVVSCVAH